MNLLRPSLLLCLALAGQAGAQNPDASPTAAAPATPDATTAANAKAAEPAEPTGEDEPVSDKEIKSAVRKDAAAAPAEETAAAASSAALKKKLDSFLPVGRTMNDLLLPKYRTLSDTAVAEKEDGSEVRQPLWESIFQAESATRLDENHIAFRKARFLAFEEDAEDPTRATSAAWLEQGIFDVQNNLLLSDQPVRIDREGMQIEGDRMLYDRMSRLTRLTGRVRMRFYAAEPEPQAPAEGAAAAEVGTAPATDAKAPPADTSTPPAETPATPAK